MKKLLLDKKGANRLPLTLAGADWETRNEQERPHYPRRRSGVHLATVCRNVARNYYPVAQKLTICTGCFGRCDAESHCASGSHLECFYEPRKQHWSRNMLEHENSQRSASLPPQRSDDHYLQLELVVDDNVQPSDFNHVEDVDNG